MTDQPAPARGHLAINRGGFEFDLGCPRDGFTFWWRVWKFWIESRYRLDLIDQQNGYEAPDKGGLDALIKTMLMLAAFLILCSVAPR